MRRILLAATALVAFNTAALSADMPVKAPAYQVAPAPYESWTGFYAGLNGGYGWASRALLGDTSDSPCCVKPRGWFGGGQLGYNYEINRWVWGIETDIQGADISRTVHDLNFGDTLQSKVDWFGTVRGRLGYAFNPLLVYFTGGFAYGNVNNSAVGPVLTASPYHIDHVATGYVLGGGFEYKIAPNWSLKAEYQYINLGKNDPTNPAGVAYDSFASPPRFVRDTDFHTVRVGVNYLFGTR
jgi:outer membrane immunogenic protein